MKDQLTQLCSELQQKGIKLTPARKIMLEILLQADRKLTNASELYDLTRAKNSRINFSTVYRNLEVLVDAGLVEKISFDGAARYKLSEKGTHRHHLICTSCNKTQPLPYCPMVELEEAVQKSTGFLPTEHRVEIFGYCAECSRNKKTRS